MGFKPTLQMVAKTTRNRYDIKMDPVREHQLRRRISSVIKEKGQFLVRKSPGEEGFEKFGRWSRWGDRNYCFETHIDLEEFARRIDCRDGIVSKLYLTRFRSWINPGY